jgi:hypothetical protein
MVGIEKAFNDFVKRVSEKENHEQKNAERGFQYGGGAIGYADGGRVRYSSGSGYPPVEDNQSVEFGQSLPTIPTGFNFTINPPALPTPQPNQEPISGNFRDLKSMMSNINPQLSYTGDNFGANVAANINTFTKAPIVYSADAHFGPEQDRYNLGFNIVPNVGAKQISLARQSPYGELSLGASRDPMGRRLTVNYNHSFANGGHVNPQGVETLFKRRYT